jgi:hypothetical protein
MGGTMARSARSGFRRTLDLPASLVRTTLSSDGSPMECECCFSLPWVAVETSSRSAGDHPMTSPSQPPSSLQLLCVACVDLLGVDGAGISIMTASGAGGSVGASGALAAQVEEWQFSLGEGPCKQAFTAGRPVIVSDVAADTLGHVAGWPVFADTIRQVGINAIFAFPLLIYGQAIGVLDIFREQPGRLSSEQTGVARAFADLAATLLHAEVETAQKADGGGTGDENIYRFEVHQASGMVSVQLGIGTQEALLRLRGRAFAEGRTVTELATDVVARRLRFDEDDL